MAAIDYWAVTAMTIWMAVKAAIGSSVAMAQIDFSVALAVTFFMAVPATTNSLVGTTTTC
jgi:hypothetical protein